MLWNLATLAGGQLGNALGDPRRFGLDAAAAAAFLALLWPRLSSATPRWVTLGGATVAVMLIPLAPAGVPVLAAALVGVTTGLHEGSRPSPGHGRAIHRDTGPTRATHHDTRPAEDSRAETGSGGPGHDDRQEAR